MTKIGGRLSIKRERRGRWLLASLILVSVLLTTAAKCDAIEPNGEGQVPDLLGMSLDEAEDKLDGAGFASPDTHDVVDDRNVFVESNWVVVSQDPAPGITVDRKIQLQLGIAKPDDEEFDDLLAAIQGDEGPLRDRQIEQDRQAEDARAEEAKERDPCNLLNGVSVDTRLFDSSLQEAKRDIAEPDEVGFKQVTLGMRKRR